MGGTSLKPSFSFFFNHWLRRLLKFPKPVIAF